MPKPEKSLRIWQYSFSVFAIIALIVIPASFKEEKRLQVRDKLPAKSFAPMDDYRMFYLTTDVNGKGSVAAYDATGNRLGRLPQ